MPCSGTRFMCRSFLVSQEVLVLFSDFSAFPRHQSFTSQLITKKNRYPLPTVRMVPTTPTSTIPRSSAGLKLCSPPTASLCAAEGRLAPKLALTSSGRRSSQLRPRAQQQHKSAGGMPSRPIPLPPTHIPRTISELQLREDMAVAEWREMCMFQRLVAGMKERKESKQMMTPLDSRDSCLKQQQQGAAIPILTPKMITPQESPSAYHNTTGDATAQLADLLCQASNISEMSVTTKTAGSSSALKHRQQRVHSNDWSVEGFHGTTIESSIAANDVGDDNDEIFSMDI